MKNEKGKERHGPEEGEEDLASESDDDDGSDDGCDRAMFRRLSPRPLAVSVTVR
jgi:hypothetical protein